MCLMLDMVGTRRYPTVQGPPPDPSRALDAAQRWRPPSSYGHSRLLARLPWLSPRRAGEPNPRPGPAARCDPTSAGVLRTTAPTGQRAAWDCVRREGHAPGDRVLRGNVSPCPATTRERHHHRRRRRFQSPHDVCALAQCSPLHLQLIAELIAGIHASAIRRPPRCHPHSIFVTEGRAARDG